MVNSGENIFSETTGNFEINLPGLFFGGRGVIGHTN